MIVKSVSCPTAEITGISDANTARANPSWLNAARSSADPPPRAAIVETPLLFEAGMDGVYDATIAVVADEAIRAERAATRGHASADERAARQLPQEEKAKRATFAVHNDGTVEELEAKLSEVLGKLEAQ